MLSEQIACIRQRIVAACRRCGRDPSTVTLIGVTKGVPVEAIRQALALGLTDLGENRVQEARGKQNALGVSNVECRMSNELPDQSTIKHPQSKIPGAVSPIRWHMIGHLQRNKVKDAVAMFDVIHSVETPALAEEIERQAAKQGKALEVFVQVNVSGEASKFGCRPDEAVALATAVRGLPHLRLAGLMTIAPFTDNPETTRPVFRQLRQLRDELQMALTNAPTRKPANAHTALSLSMGMSQDFEVAIEEGADTIRIGTALFGARDHEGQGAGDG